jgi:hypothetical protein
MDLDPGFLDELDRLIEEQRAATLWSLRVDYHPRTPAEVEKVLRTIEQHADLATFQRARALRTWLSRLTSVSSAAS